MSDLVQLLPLWNALRAAQTEYVLATVVEVEGSGYRKPGARMLVAADGRRAGTISGGCLEAEVARKAFWHTEHGPVLRRYSTSSEDGEVPFGMGCGGVVHLLLERSSTADVVLQRLAASFENREPLAIATALEGDLIVQRGFWPASPLIQFDPRISANLNDLARQSFERQRSFSEPIEGEDRQITTVRAEWIAPRPGLFIFGAGDDAIPLAEHARLLGWYVAICDGRSHLATPVRFPLADDVHVLPAGDFPPLPLRSTDAAVVMTHSLQQDTRILGGLLKQDLTYVGVLGPRRRTQDMLLTLAGESGLPPSEQTFKLDEQIETWLERLHAPMGLDLGGDTPSGIALAVIAEIQQTLHHATGLSLRKVRSGTFTSQTLRS